MTEAAEIIREIASDRKRGATALAERALDALAASRRTADELAAVRPGMPLIAAVVRRALKRGVAEARRELRSSQRRLVRASREVLPVAARYIVFGESGTVEAVLRAVRAKVVRTLPADVGLVGADALLPGGDFVNAKGTGEFLRRVRRRGRCGVFAVASELKRVMKAPELERGFEVVPGRLVHAVLTEKGLVYPPMGVFPTAEPSWLDRGALDVEGGRGHCHPHHKR
jgi:translation initiation factor 2B subunit (eIF-2B alpha/beta/delta family)